MTSRAAALALFFIMILGCTGIPEGLEAVGGFDVDRYLGKWYEIARLDHPFERGLSNVTAEYSRGAGNEIRVFNRGFDTAKGEWREIRGRARLIGDPGTGSLEVSFFGPFWGGYHIIALDRENYAYAMVTGPTRSYLWILARDKRPDEQVVADLVSRARVWGFETERLIFVVHDMPVMDVSGARTRGPDPDMRG